MPLNKFIPLSPDPNITRDSDMGMAQFGHLNTIVDYLNTYVAADSLQLDGTGPLSTTLRAVTDAAGNLSPLKISTTAVQVVSPLRITTDDPSDMYLDCEDGATNNRFNITRNTASQQVNLNFASNPGGSTSIVGAIRTYVDGVNLSEVMTFREDGRLTIYNTLKSIYDNYSDLGTNAERFANVYALSGRFTNVSTNTLGPLGAATWINISSSVFSLVGGQLSIKGSGSTSATTSLLVQNSSATPSTEIFDDGTFRHYRSAFFQNGGTISFASDRISMQGYTSFGIRYRSANLFELYASDPNDMIGMQIGKGLSIYDAGASTSLDNSAKLQINSTTRGFLKPKMTTAQKNAIATPTAGLEVYDTDLNRPCFYSGSAWVTL